MLFIGRETFTRCRWDSDASTPPNFVMATSFVSHRCDCKGVANVCGDQSHFHALQPRATSHLIEHGHDGAVLGDAGVRVQAEPLHRGLATPGPIVGWCLATIEAACTCSIAHANRSLATRRTPASCATCTRAIQTFHPCSADVGPLDPHQRFRNAPRGTHLHPLSSKRSARATDGGIGVISTAPWGWGHTQDTVGHSPRRLGRNP